MRKQYCFQCGRAFTPARSDQLYCSKQCRLKSYRNGIPVIPVKTDVFDRILSGDQTEICREITPYWTNRFIDLFGKMLDISCTPPKMVWDDGAKLIEFRNGTGDHMRKAEAECTIREGVGKEVWGARPGKEYYILAIKQVSKQETELEEEKQYGNDSKTHKNPQTAPQMPVLQIRSLHLERHRIGQVVRRVQQHIQTHRLRRADAGLREK